MKQTSKMVMVAVALMAGVSGNAWANGTEMPPAPAPYTPPPAPVEAPAPAPAPVVKASNEGVYISGTVGIGFPSMDVLGNNVDLDNGLVLNGALGYNFGSTRLEAAVGYQKHDVSNVSGVDVSLLTVMANAYYDFDAGSGIKPYVMAGAGLGHTHESWLDTSKDVFAWQVGAGLGFKVADNTTLDLGYRYLKPGKIEDAIETHSSNVMLGLRYQF